MPASMTSWIQVTWKFCYHNHAYNVFFLQDLGFDLGLQFVSGFAKKMFVELFTRGRLGQTSTSSNWRPTEKHDNLHKLKPTRYFVEMRRRLLLERCVATDTTKTQPKKTRVVGELNSNEFGDKNVLLNE